jgi:hypothetical protein
MKKVFIYSVAIGLMLMLYSCGPDTPESCWMGGRPYCHYEYPLNVKNLKDTIKTTDTLWVENDLDAHFCLSQPLKDGNGVQAPFFFKLVNDSLTSYAPFITNYTGKRNSGLNTGYEIKFDVQEGRYKSKYGIVFSDTGIYEIFYYPLEQMKFGKKGSCHLEMSSYFDVPDNNNYLLPKKLAVIYNSKPYREYFLVVVE